MYNSSTTQSSNIEAEKLKEVNNVLVDENKRLATELNYVGTINNELKKEIDSLKEDQERKDVQIGFLNDEVERLKCLAKTFLGVSPSPPHAKEKNKDRPWDEVNTSKAGEPSAEEIPSKEVNKIEGVNLTEEGNMTEEGNLTEEGNTKEAATPMDEANQIEAENMTEGVQKNEVGTTIEVASQLDAANRSEENALSEHVHGEGEEGPMVDSENINEILSEEGVVRSSHM